MVDSRFDSFCLAFLKLAMVWIVHLANLGSRCVLAYLKYIIFFNKISYTPSALCSVLNQTLVTETDRLRQMRRQRTAGCVSGGLSQAACLLYFVGLS